MRKQQLVANIFQKKSFLCVGLDTDPDKLPGHLGAGPKAVLEFNKQIIEATSEHCVAYKPNLAFYESMGPAGMEVLQGTLEMIPSTHFTIADAKRGDIGNTSAMYAKSFFEYYGFDAVTVAPYMGKDSVVPFLGFKDKWAIVLGITSNEGSSDFQMSRLGDGLLLFEKVLHKVREWGNSEELMVVAGATHPNLIASVRGILPEYFMLVPGVGAQGGDLQEVCNHGMNNECGLLVNASRSILYASSDKDFSKRAKEEAAGLHEQMRLIIEERFK